MPRKTVELRWPTGVVRRLPVRDTPAGNAWPSPWAMNSRLEDSLTNRLRGGSFVGQDPGDADDSFAFLLTEDGKALIAEDGDYIVVDRTTRYVYVTTENGDTITTENGDQIVVGPQDRAATGHERIWVAGGDDAPAAGTADAVYRDRLFRVSDQIILCSRQGDLTDWDYGGELEDTGRPMVFQLSEAREDGVNPVALVPHKDAYLLCFSAGETWILSGDPTTGTLRNVSRSVGIIAPRAWCKNHDTVYFLSSRGLYSVGADGSGLKPVSEDQIPVELTGITDEYCVLTYTHANRCVNIHLTTSPSWVFDVAREQFWPFDTEETESHVLFGPFQFGEGRNHGRIINFHGNVAASSASVTWRLVTGDTAEEAAANGKAAITAALAGTSYSSYVAASGTWAAGRSHMAYPRIRALWCCVWLSSAGVWAYETASLEATISRGWR